MTTKAMSAALAADAAAAEGADGQVRVDTCQSSSLITNGSFEQPVVPDASDGRPTYKVFADSMVDGWQTSPRVVELWQNRFLGVPAAQGAQFAEIATGKTYPSSLYQDAATVPGESISYAFGHRGRYRSSGCPNGWRPGRCLQRPDRRSPACRRGML